MQHWLITSDEMQSTAPHLRAPHRTGLVDIIAASQLADFANGSQEGAQRATMCFGAATAQRTDTVHALHGSWQGSERTFHAVTDRSWALQVVFTALCHVPASADVRA